MNYLLLKAYWQWYSYLSILELRNMDLEVRVFKRISHGKWLLIDFKIGEGNLIFDLVQLSVSIFLTKCFLQLYGSIEEGL